MLFPLAVFALVAVYFMTPAERQRVLQWILARLRLAQNGAHHLRTTLREPLHAALCQRTPWALVTPALVAVNVAVFGAMVMGVAPIGDPDTLVEYGGNFAPRTTNGEWGRLITAIFVHRSVFDLVVNVAALVSVGVLLERLVGPLTFLAVYIGAGALAGLTNLSLSLTTVSVGASPAIFGLYGLLLTSWAYGVVQQATTTVRLAEIARLTPPAVVFLAYTLLADRTDAAAESTGLVTGFIAGLVLGRYLREGRPPARKVAMTMAAAAMITLISAAPLQGVADVRPAFARMLAVEDRITKEYDAAVKRFTRGHLSATSLAAVIDEKVAPELESVRRLLDTLQRVPPEHRPLVAAAETYLRVRQEGWRIRAAALRKADAAMLREAERAERASLDALAIVRRGA